MSDSDSSCRECLEIARELKEAYAEAYARNWASADALKVLIGGTEEDAERADELVSAYQYHPRPELPELAVRLRAVMLRSDHHLARSGHWPWPKREAK